MKIVNCGRHLISQTKSLGSTENNPGWTTRGCKPQATNLTSQPIKPQSSSPLATGTAVVNVILVARQTSVALTVGQTNPMKANTTKNLASVVTLAILASIKTAGIRNNEVLLLMLTLLSAVLSGINGFGRRTATAVQLSPVKTKSRGADPSTVSVMFAGSSK
jgi:hypothetical protein